LEAEMKLKPVPKLILILAVVGGVGYGVNTYLESHKGQLAQPAPQEAIAPTVQQQAPVQASAPAPTYQQAPVQEAPAQDQGSNAGLSKLLQGKK
jgi:hypothetical protein